jgi:hypothetical protein
LSISANYLPDSTEAAFLGDPDFPGKSIKKTRGTKIQDFTSLYKQYTQLHMSRMDDRPFAIAGLENRLLAPYGFCGQYGVFDATSRGFFHRSLLWKRGEKEFMKRIKFGGNENFTFLTWSWMSLAGAIDYLTPDNEQYDWEDEDVKSTWSVETKYSCNTSYEPTLRLEGKVRNFRMAIGANFCSSIIFDTQEPKGGAQQCVVIARVKGRGQGKANHGQHYVLLVSKVETQSNGQDIYERIGIGYWE